MMDMTSSANVIPILSGRSQCSNDERVSDASEKKAR